MPKGGSIIITSGNGGGVSVSPMAAAYASSKGGVKRFTKVLVVDFANLISVARSWPGPH